MDKFWLGFLIGQGVWVLPLALLGLYTWFTGGSDDDW